MAFSIHIPGSSKPLSAEQKRARTESKLSQRGPERAAHIANIKRRTLEHPYGKPYRKPGKTCTRYVYDEKLGKVVKLA